MPQRPLHQCNRPGCSTLTRDRLCPVHAREYEQQRGSAHRRGYDNRWRARREAFLKANGICIFCGKPATCVDHIIPLSQGGADDESNWQPSCQSCHSRKTVQEDGGFGRPRRQRHG